jgi:E3 ubiquitin-protein ligase HERC2
MLIFIDVLNYRLLLAVLIKHHDLAHVILGLIEHGQGDAGKLTFPKAIIELLRVVGQVKRSLIKVYKACLTYNYISLCGIL